MIEGLTREDAVAIIRDRASKLPARTIKHLGDNLPTGVAEAARVLRDLGSLSEPEERLIVTHNVSAAWELKQFAEEKKLKPRLKVVKPPRIN